MNKRQKVIFYLFFIPGIAFLTSSTLLFIRPKLYFCRVKTERIDKQSLYCLINKLRHKSNLQPLNPNPKLERAAELRALDIVTHNQFSHDSISGRDREEALKEANYEWLISGEVLARRFNTNQEVFDGWIKSASHSAIILDSHYQDIGITVMDANKIPEEKVVVGLLGLE
ncbi:CAP domain-containing protein [Patescibacteria group bacterium]